MKDFLDLHKDVLSHILSYCDLKDVRNLSQLSKAAKELFDNNTFWRNQLIHDFHFTAESVDKLRDKMKASYKLVYSYCENDKLNKTQENALENSVLKEKGLTENHLRGRCWFIERQYESTLEALVVRSDPVMKIDMAVAIAEIELLEEHQLLGISEGLSRVEVIGLSPCQVTALCKFESYGLTSQYLRNVALFNSADRVAALEALLKEDALTFEEAIVGISELTEVQVWGISKGLSRQDVTELSRIQMEALVALREDGLTANQLRKQSWLCYSWHIVVWKKLITDRGMTLVTAMSEMAKMAEFTEVQVYGISKGFLKEDIIGLSQAQIEAFARFRFQNVTADDLRKQDWFNSYDHVNALAKLLSIHGMTVEVAMLEISGLTDDEAYGIAGGLLRKDVSGLSRFQIQALVLLKKDGLTAEQVQGICKGCDRNVVNYDWFHSVHHVNALDNLVTIRHMTISDAMTEIRELTSDEAFGISKGFTRDEIKKLSYPQIKALAAFQDDALFEGNASRYSWALNGLIAEFRMTIKYVSRKKDISDFAMNIVGNSSERYIRHYIPVDKDGFYEAFGLARLSAKSLLIENIKSIHDVLQPAIWAALSKQTFYDFLINNDYVDSKLSKEIVENNFSTELNVALGYLHYEFRDDHIATARAHPCVLEAVAHIKGIELRLWCVDKENVLRPHELDRYSHTTHTKQHLWCRKDLLFTEEDRFERLKRLEFKDSEFFSDSSYEEDLEMAIALSVYDGINTPVPK